MNGNSPQIQPIDFGFLAVIALCLLPLVWAVLSIRTRFAEHGQRNKLPFKELKRRPAGESARLKIAELDETINDHIYGMLALPTCLAFAVFFFKFNSWVTALVFLLISIVWALVYEKRLFRLLCERRNYRLGFAGERYVGEELSGLIALGYQIYHDVPFDGFNMDHVLVGKQGVFVVETKTRRKPVNEVSGKEYRVVFNGKALVWPWGADEKDIEQARNNAATLSKWLTSAVGDPMRVSAILTLPGWWVERTGTNSTIQVLNPMEIIRFCDSRQNGLTQEMIRRVCHQLDQRCRVDI